MRGSALTLIVLLLMIVSSFAFIPTARAAPVVVDAESTRDSLVWEATPNTSNCDITSLAATNEPFSPGNGDQRTFIQFDLDAMSIPATAVITRAKLLLFMQSFDSYSSGNIEVRQVTASWTCTAPDQITWSNQPAFASTNSGEMTIDSGTQDTGGESGGDGCPTTNEIFCSVDVTSLVASWRSGAASNNGMALLLDVQATTNSISIRSDNGAACATEGTRNDCHPKLVVTYQLPPGDDEPPSGGGGGALGGNFPVDNLNRVCAAGTFDWLLATANPGGRNVTIEDLRREASLAIQYIVAWGDGQASSATQAPLFHTYEKEGLYRITVRIAYRDGSINIFDALVDVRGNNCSLQMFAENVYPVLVLTAGVALVGAIIVTGHYPKTRLTRGRRQLRNLLLWAFVIALGVLLTTAIYAQGAGIPI